MRRKKKPERLRAPVCTMCLLQKMETTWQRCLAFVSILIYFFILQLCLSLSKIKINVHNLRVAKSSCKVYPL